MGVVNQKAIKHLRIAGNQARTGTSLSTATAGEVFVVDASGTVLNTTTVNNVDKIMIAQSQGSSLPALLSPVIKKNGVSLYKGGAYVAPVQGISYLGYNGTSGSLQAINDNAYTLLVYTLDSPTWAEKSPAVIGYYESDSAATQQEVADNVCLSMYQNKKNLQAAKPFTIERVNSGADGGSLGVLATFTEDSATVTFASAVTFVAGDYLRFTNGTNTTAVYKIAAVVSTTNYTLDVPWDAASTTASTCGRILAATAAAGNFGLKMTGRVQPVSQNLIYNGGLQEYYFVRFKPNAIGFGTSTQTYDSTAAVSGSGVPAQVAVEERQLIGNSGFLHPGAMPFITPPENTNLNAVGYSFIHLEYVDVPANPVLGLDQQPKQLDIACEASVVSSGSPYTFLTNVQGAPTSVWDVLESWLVTNGSFNTAVIN